MDEFKEMFNDFVNGNLTDYKNAIKEMDEIKLDRFINALSVNEGGFQGNDYRRIFVISLRALAEKSED